MKEKWLRTVVLGVLVSVLAGVSINVGSWVVDEINDGRANSRDVKYICELLAERMTQVVKVEDTFGVHFEKDVSVPAPGGQVRAALYNRMTKEFGAALETWAVNLSNMQRRDIYHALDWYHTRPDQLYFRPTDEGLDFSEEFPEGKWPAPEMSAEEAKEKFDRLQSIKWLKIKTDCS